MPASARHALCAAQCLATDILDVHAKRSEQAAYQEAQKRHLDGEMALCGATHKRPQQDAGPAVVACRHYNPDPQLCAIDSARGEVHKLPLSEAWRRMLEAGSEVGEWPILSGEQCEDLSTCPDNWEEAFQTSGEGCSVRMPHTLCTCKRA